MTNTDPTAWSDDEDLEEISIDPSDPLAHLYADAGDVVDVDLPLRKTTLDALEKATPAPDEISDGDVEELALLVKSKIDMTDEESAALGLGTFRLVDGTEVDPDDEALGDVEIYFDLNSTGLRVVKRIAEKEGLLG